MKILQDTRLDEFLRIEQLLYGNNYEVWFNLYGPSSLDLNLDVVLQKLVSKDCELLEVTSSTPEEAESEIMEMVLYKGDAVSGPVKLESKKDEIVSLMNKVLVDIDFRKADSISKFTLKNGHPSYGVFWDFSYDIRTNNNRWILIGSSSD